MIYFLLWLFFSIAVGMFAHYRRKRNGFGWFAVAFIPPIIGHLVMAIPLLPLMFLSLVVPFVTLAILQPQTRQTERKMTRREIIAALEAARAKEQAAAKAAP